MGELFQNVLEASFHGGIVIAVVLLTRLALKKAPKKYICLLWLLAALRLLLPIEIESAFSLQPDLTPSTQSGSANVQREDIPEDTMAAYPGSPTIPDTQGYPEDIVSVTTPNAVEEEPKAAVDDMQLLSWIWLTAAAGMIAYSLVSYLRLRRRVGDAVILSEGIWVSGRIESPFVMGFFRPRIYISPCLGEKEREYVLAHEKCHIRRGDHWWKLLGYITLAVHWFNPLVWLGYVLLCRDLEMACDEAVVKEMEVAERKAYSTALLACSAKGHAIAACPVAFGEVSVKGRIRNVLNYRKPKFWLILAAVVAVLVIAVCFLTSPMQNSLLQLSGVSAREITGISLQSEGGLVSISGKQELAEVVEALKKVRCGEIAEDLPGEAESMHSIYIACGEKGVTLCFAEDFEYAWLSGTEIYPVQNPSALWALFVNYFNGVSQREASGEPFAAVEDVDTWVKGIRLDAVEESEYYRQTGHEDSSTWSTVSGVLREAQLLELLDALNALPEGAITETYTQKDASDFLETSGFADLSMHVTITDGVNGFVAMVAYDVDEYGRELLRIGISDNLNVFEECGRRYDVQWWFITDDTLCDVMRDFAEHPPIVQYIGNAFQSKWYMYAYCQNVTATGLQFCFEQYNATDVTGELFYGQAYTLEKWDGTQWVAVRPIIENGAFTMEGILLPKNTTTVVDINWEWLYGEVADGYYRISKDVWLGSERQMFYVYFGIGEGYGDLPTAQTEEALREATLAVISDRAFTYEKPGFGGAFTIQIFGDGTFSYYEGMLSSYIGMGNWTLDGDLLCLSDEGMTDRVWNYYFKVVDDALVFQADPSHSFIYVDVADGERFFASTKVEMAELTAEQVIDMCAAAYEELHNAGCYFIRVDASDGLDSYQWKNGESSWFTQIIDSGWYDCLVHGEVYYRISQEMAQANGIPMGWIDQDYVEENRIGYLGSLGSVYFWELWSWDEWAPEYKWWELTLDGVICEFADKEDPDTSWQLTLDTEGKLKSIEKIMDGRIVEACTILSLDQVYVANRIASEYADAYRSVPNAVIVRDQAFYEELFTRQTDGAYATMWIGHLYEAFYAEPEEFARQLSRKFSGDPAKAREVLTCMSYEVEFYEPERFVQTLENLRNVAELDQNIVDLLYWYYWEGEYRALGGGSGARVSDSGQDCLAAALEGCEIMEGRHLQVSSGSMFRYTYVSCRVEADTYITELYRGQGTFDENTYAFNLYVTFVPENDEAYACSMAGNTGEYTGDDPDVPEDALVYSRCGYVTWTEDGWQVQIVGTGW